MIPKEKRNEIIDRYNNYEKVFDIAKDLDVSMATVSNVVRKGREQGIIMRTPRSRAQTVGLDDRNARIIEMYNSGSTLEAIGEYFDITREGVRQILKKAGVQRRVGGERRSFSHDRIMAQNGPQIDALFDKYRSLPKVLEEMKGSGVPYRWIREYLAPRRNEAVKTQHVEKLWSDETLLSILRMASGGKGTVTSNSYEKWRETALIDGKRPPTHAVIAWRFGSWRNALNAAGLADRPAYREYSRRWTKEDAFKAVADYVAEAEAEGKRGTFNGYDAWSRTRNVPSGAYLRILTGMTWSQIMWKVTTKSVFS